MFTLRDGTFDITLGSSPCVLQYTHLPSHTVIVGNANQQPPVFTTLNLLTHELEFATVSYEAFQKSAHELTWECKIDTSCDTIYADIVAHMVDNRLSFVLTNVRESQNTHLVTVRLNGLVAATTQDPHARMALPAHGGRLINPATCLDGDHDHRYNWILDSLGSTAIVYTSCLTAVTQIRLMDDEITTKVGGTGIYRYAQVGALLRRRYTDYDVSYRKAKYPCDSITPKEEEYFGACQDFSLNNEPSVSIDLIEHNPISSDVGWIIGAKYIRDHLPGKQTDFYRDRMVYKIYIGSPNQEVQTNLQQIHELTELFAKRTSNAGQLIYLVGFQHKGHDTAYPDVFTINPALKSIDSLGALVNEASKYNCCISFHDNFDDAYRNSPAWDTDDISRDSTGHLLHGGIWNNNQAYWNSMPIYAAHKADSRIQRTLQTYPFIKETYHLDVLTASVFRVDFRQDCPSGRQEDLIARKSIIEKFRRHGLDVSSEACGLPFIGTISYFWHMQRIPRQLYENDARIPMVPFIVHGKADYAGTHSMTMHDILDGLLYGGFYCNDVTSHTSVMELTNAYFMLQFPLNLLRNDFAESYEESNDWKTIRYSSGAEISVRFETEECRVTINNIRYIENGTAMLPQSDGSTILYRCQEEPYADIRWQTPYPADTELKAIPIGAELPTRILIVEQDGCIPVDTEVGIAYRISL